MSNAQTWSAVNIPEKVVELDADAFCAPLTAVSASPIDDFYGYLSSLVVIGTRNALESHPALGRVLLLGLVSGTEYYFRTLLSKLVQICPVAKAHALPQTLTFGATEYYSKDDIGFALLEGHSFSSKAELVKQTDRIVNIKWKDNSSLASAVAEFDRLCHLRHAAIHSRGDLGARNIQEMKLGTVAGRVGVKVTFDGFQEAASVCQNVVRAYNAFIYEECVRRWIDNGFLLGTWNKDRKLYSRVFALCYSAKDINPSLNVKDAYSSFLPDLKKAAVAKAKRAGGTVLATSQPIQPGGQGK